MIEHSDWHNLYSEGWQNEIHPDAFSHPAKFSRALIRHIYRHCAAEGWLSPGSSVIDPFGGVGLGALDAMLHGCTWTGIELEPRFVDLARQNIELWNGRYAGKMPRWGTATVLQGDSRRLVEVIREAEICISSPPYADGCAHTGGDDPHPEHIQGGVYRGVGIDAAISSPPYADSMDHAPGNKSWDATPTENQIRHGNNGYSGQVQKTTDYGTTPGQLGAMRGDFEAVISSPGYGGSEIADNRKTINSTINGNGRKDGKPRGDSLSNVIGSYTAGGNISALQDDNFWTAARAILEQTYSALSSGGHAVWVVKDFVRAKKRVEFSDQWRRLCEAVGFTTLHVHRAWVVEHKGSQLTIDGGIEHQVTERKSFFRRLAEKKGSPRIDWETVICMVRP